MKYINNINNSNNIYITNNININNHNYNNNNHNYYNKYNNNHNHNDKNNNEKIKNKICGSCIYLHIRLVDITYELRLLDNLLSPTNTLFVGKLPMNFVW